MKHSFAEANEYIELRPFSSNDSELYRQLRNQEHNRRCFLSSGVITETAQQQWYEAYLKKANDYMFSIYTKKGLFLGGAALYDVHGQSAEFGRILIDKSVSPKGGVGYQVLLLLCKIAHEQLHLQSLHLEVFEDNLPAVKTYEKAGFQKKKWYSSSDGSRTIIYMERFLEVSL